MTPTNQEQNYEHVYALPSPTLPCHDPVPIVFPAHVLVLYKRLG